MISDTVDSMLQHSDSAEDLKTIDCFLTFHKISDFSNLRQKPKWIFCFISIFPNLSQKKLLA